MAAGVCFLSEHPKHPSPATAFPVPGFFLDITWASQGSAAIRAQAHRSTGHGSVASKPERVPSTTHRDPNGRAKLCDRRSNLRKRARQHIDERAVTSDYGAERATVLKLLNDSLA